MNFSHKLIPALFIKRYKRFLADVKFTNGEIITVHCPNSGSLKSCMHPGWPVLLSESNNKNRKYKYTWEMVHNGICWIGINTAVPNRVCLEAIQYGRITELSGYHSFFREKKYGRNSRIDILLESGDKKCFVEVKNVTLLEDDGHYYFPDAVTERGRKHLYELKDMVYAGHRSVMLFLVQRSDGRKFKTASHIDLQYSAVLETCVDSGVEVIVYRADVTPEKIEVAERLEWLRD